jgi:hypothetical protein
VDYVPQRLAAGAVPFTERSSEGLGIASRHNVDFFGTRLAAEDNAAALVMAKPDSLKETDTANVATVGDAEHLLHARDAEEDAQSLADCCGSDAATLGSRGKSEAELAGKSIGSEKDADIPNKLIGFGLSDTELDPFTRCEQRCFAHIG